MDRKGLRPFRPVSRGVSPVLQERKDKIVFYQLIVSDKALKASLM